jgi:hypothetical protein
MAEQEFRGQEKQRFPALVGIGIALAIAVIVVAFVVDSEIGIPVLVLAVVCVGAAVGYRVIAGSNRSAERDAEDAGPPKAPPDQSRPLGDTPEAHDEVSPRDLPPDHPGRETAEEVAGGADGTTRGPLP